MNTLKSYLILILLSLPTAQLKGKNDDGIIFAGIAGCVGGLVWCANELFKSTSYNEGKKRISNAEQKIKLISKEYSQLLLLLPTSSPSETHLTAFAQHLPQTKSILTLEKDVAQLLTGMRKDNEYLQKNLKKWQNDPYYDDLIGGGRETIRSLEVHIQSLQLLHSYIQQHTTYFAMKTNLNQLRNEFAQEFSTLHQSSYFNNSTNYELEKIICIKYFNHDECFPLLAYAKRLEPLLLTLEKNHRKLPTGFYPALAQECGDIRNALVRIKTFIATHPQYDKEKTDFAIHQQNEDMVKARKQEINLLAEKNRLDRKKLEEEQRKNDLLLKQNKINKEKAKHYEHYSRHIPELRRIIIEIQKTIYQLEKEIIELNDRVTYAAGYNPACQEYQDIMHLIHYKRTELENVYRYLDRITQQLKSMEQRLGW